METARKYDYQYDAERAAKFDKDAASATQLETSRLADQYLADQKRRNSTLLLEAVAEWAWHWELNLRHADIRLESYVEGLDTGPVINFATWAYPIDEFVAVRKGVVNQTYERSPTSAYPDLRAAAFGTDRYGQTHEFTVRWVGVLNEANEPDKFTDGATVPW